MMTIPEWRAALAASAARQEFSALYGEDVPRQIARYRALLDAYCAAFNDGNEVSIFSAPGRSEIGGNHTDHQNGRVLAAAVTLDAVACAAKADGGVVAIAGHVAGLRTRDVGREARPRRGRRASEAAAPGGPRRALQRRAPPPRKSRK